eukprot:280430_1
MHLWILIFSFVVDNYNAQIIWNDASETLPSTRAAQVIGYDKKTGLAWILGGWITGTEFSDVYSYNITSGIISHHGQLSIGNVAMNTGQAYTTIGTTIYFIQDTNDIYTFDMKTGAIIANNIPAAPIGEGIECMAHFLNKYLIVIGLSVSDIYDFETQQWLMTVPALNTQRQGSSCQVYDKYVYIFGGRNSIHLNTIEKLDLTTLFSWQILPTTLTFTTYLLRTTLVGDKIFVTGGYNGGYLSNVNVFSTLDESITIAASLPRVINRHAMITTSNSEVIIIGGRGVGSSTYDAITVSNAVQCELKVNLYSPNWASLVADGIGPLIILNDGNNSVQDPDGLPRGFNVLAIDQTTEDIDFNSFDMMLGHDAQMELYLNTVESNRPGSFIFVVVSDEGSGSPLSMAKLGTWGCNKTSVGFRNAFIFIGTASDTNIPPWTYCETSLITAAYFINKTFYIPVPNAFCTPDLTWYPTPNPTEAPTQSTNNPSLTPTKYPTQTTVNPTPSP